MKIDENLYVLPSQHTDKTVKTRPVNTAINVLWIIFVGIPSVVINAIAGVILCITILGIPAGIKCFNFIPLVFAPAGKEVRLYYGKHKFWNTVSLIFGGAESYFIYMFYALLLMITIIGIPFGLQMMKIASFHLAPYGVEIVPEHGFTTNRDHPTDYRLLREHIIMDDKPVMISDGMEMAASSVRYNILTDKEAVIFSQSGLDIRLKNSSGDTLVEKVFGYIFGAIIGVAVIFGLGALLIFIIYLISHSPATYEWGKGFLALGIFCLGAFVIVSLVFLIVDIIGAIKMSRGMKIYKKKLKNMTTYYPLQCDLPKTSIFKRKQKTTK